MEDPHLAVGLTTREVFDDGRDRCNADTGRDQHQGPSDSSSTRSPQGCETSSTAPGLALSPNQFDTWPSGSPANATDTLDGHPQRIAAGPDEIVYRRGLPLTAG